MSGAMTGAAAAAGDRIRVLPAEDEHLIRDALVALLQLEHGIEVVAEAATGGGALSAARALRPDVAILDLQLPEVDGIEVARMINSELSRREDSPQPSGRSARPIGTRRPGSPGGSAGSDR